MHGQGPNFSTPSEDDEASEEDDMSKGGVRPSKGRKGAHRRSKMSFAAAKVCVHVRRVHACLTIMPCHLQLLAVFHK